MIVYRWCFCCLVGNSGKLKIRMKKGEKGGVRGEMRSLRRFMGIDYIM